MPGRVHRVARPESLTLPAGLLVVDPSRGVSRVESQRIWYAQRQRLSGLRHHHKERVRIDVTGQDHVFPEAERVLPVDFGQI